MQTKWQKQPMNWRKPIYIFPFRITEINVCLTRVPFNRWQSFQGFLTNGMLNSSHDACTVIYFHLLCSLKVCQPLHTASIWNGSLVSSVLYSWRNKVLKTVIYLSASRYSSSERGTSGPRHTTHTHVPQTNAIHWYRWRGLFQQGRGRWVGPWASRNGQKPVWWVCHIKIGPKLYETNKNQATERKGNIKWELFLSDNILHVVWGQGKSLECENTDSILSQKTFVQIQSRWAGFFQSWCHVTWAKQYLPRRATGSTNEMQWCLTHS